MDMDWCRRHKLGHGSFAQVNLAVPKTRSSPLPPLMAVKSCAASISSSLLNEQFILEDLRDCPQIIRCHGGDYSCENGDKLYNVLLEFASGGSLADKLKFSGNGGLPQHQVQGYTKALLKGLNYIHKFGYVHCDIKLQNILLCSDGGVKIADFGLAKRGGGTSELRGTPMYMSPEMVAGGEQGAPADIWALGCVVAEMAAGYPAWNCSDVAALMMRIGVGEEVPEIPQVLSAEGKDFLQKCFVKDPRRRWTAEMLLNHPFVCGQEIDGRDALKDGEENSASTSPRCPFDFQDWESTSTSSMTYLPSPSDPNSSAWMSSASWSVSSAAADRLRSLISVAENGPDWSVSDDWVTIR